MAEEQLLEAWQQKIKQRSMTILRDVQKLLGHLKESSFSKLSGVASDIGQHAVELMNTVEDVGFTSKAGDAVLQTLASLKSTLVATMKQAEGVSTTTNDEAAQDQLRNECKSTAALIKQLNQQVAELTPADLASSDTPEKEEKSANGEAPEWLRQMHQESTKAGDALVSLQKAAIQHDQPNLVGSAKNLSAHCAELLNEARRRKKDSLGDTVKENVLNVISVAKSVFKASGDDSLHQGLAGAVTATKKAIEELVDEFNRAAGYSPNGSGGTSTDASPVASSSSPTGAKSATTKTPKVTTKAAAAAATTSPSASSSSTSSSSSSSTLKDTSSYSSAETTSPVMSPRMEDDSPRDTEPAPSSSSSAQSGSSAASTTTTAAASAPAPAPSQSQSQSSSSSAAKSSSSDAGDVKPPGDLLSPKDASKQLQREFSSRDPEKVFKVQEMLGEGASGAVFRAVHRETKKVVAIKKMQVGVNNITSTVKEIKIMKDLKSPFTLKYYGCYQKDDYIWIIMEYCDGGSVQDMIDMRENEDVCLTEPQIAQITGQVLKALEYLHGLKKIHRDIKAGNILVNSRGMAKLADFGISAQQVGDEKRTTTIGSSYWMAPETLMGGGYDSKADIWSLGITLMEMAEGIPPLIEEQPHKAAFRIVNDPPPKLSRRDQWSPQFNDFLARCLTKNPDKRPTAADLLAHPFVKQAEGQSKELLELLAWVEKHKKKGKKKTGLSLKQAILGGGSKSDLEEEANLNVHFGEDADARITLLVASHVTAEDICRQCSDQFKISKDPKAYSLFLVVDDGSGKLKEKALGQYEYPVKMYNHVAKKLKKSKVKDPVKLVYKA